MTCRIHQLDPLVANQIAAGEVIERPASIVKELLENAIDAGATRIEIDIEKAGKQLIRIRDNGEGIHEADLAICLSRHATSKITTSEDLSTIDTLGFRGEALASIAAVAKVKVTSRQKEASVAMQAVCTGENTQVEVTPASHPQGTTLEVSQLFFNTPARMKFLRSERTEFLKIQEVLKHIALINNQVAFTLRHNGKRILQLSAGSSSHTRQLRVSKICGKAFMDHAVYLEMQGNDIILRGYVGLPEIAKSHADIQYFYVNGRMVRDRLIMHAIREAYAEHLLPGKYPATALFLRLPAKDVDVNVHPTKHEVRFHEGRFVHDFIVKALQEALYAKPGEQDATQALVVQANQAIASQTKASQGQAVAKTTGHDVSNIQKQTKVEAAPLNASSADHTPATKKPLQEAVKVKKPASQNKAEQLAYFEALLSGDTDDTTDACDPKIQKQNEKTTTAMIRKINVIEMIEKAYALISTLQGFWLLDLKEAMYKHTYHAWDMMIREQGQLKAVPLLLPITFNYPDAEKICQYSFWTTLGFVFEALGPEELVVRSAPQPLSQLALAACFEACLAAFQEEDSNLLASQMIARLSRLTAPFIAEDISMSELVQILQDGLSAESLAQYAKLLTPEVCQRILTSL